jgi:two-component system KDP operon response regulator KdpE
VAKVWGPEYRDESHYLRLYVTYLRQKIEEDPPTRSTF